MSETLGADLLFHSTRFFTPLASSTMILQATPLAVVIGASFFFKEKVGALRWVAVITGLFGVLIIIQPTAANFSILSILAVLGMLGFAGRDLASRAVSKSIHVLTLGVHGFLSIAAAGVFLAVFFDENFIYPDLNTVWLLLLGSVLGAVGYSSIISAMRIGEVSAIHHSVIPYPVRYCWGFYLRRDAQHNPNPGVVLIVASSFAVVYPSSYKPSKTGNGSPST